MNNTNGVMMQFFQWYTPADGSLWREVAEKAQELASCGIAAIWLPPACKGAAGGFDTGYGIYDLFDLGEFNQKNSIRTKYGSKAEYIQAIVTAQQHGVSVYADVVFNHKLGADDSEETEATPLNPENRNQSIDQYQKIKAWTHFTFPGRGGKYSSMEWHWWHFDAIDHNEYNQAQSAVYLLKGKSFDTNIDLEKGNFDYLMGCDLDMKNPEVAGELKFWGEWFYDTTKIDGFRFDAVKHVNAEFFQEWLEHVRNYSKKDLFAVGEYWSYQIEALKHFIDSTDGKIHLFDVPLHYNFQQASKAGANYDLRQIFDNTLVQSQPTLAVTLVENHDSQPLQSLESVVENWFKPLAYAFILLREAGYPCIFYADYYGAHYKDKGRDGQEYEIWLDCHKETINKFLKARQNHAFGEQKDYFDNPNIIGWTRAGDSEHKGMAVILSNGSSGSKWMETGRKNTTYFDFNQVIKETVTSNKDGWAEFKVLGGSVSIWLEE